MNIRTEIDKDLTNALRTGDDLRKRTLRMAIAAIKLAEVDRGEKLDDQAVISLLQKEIKSRRESIADAQRAQRTDLIEQAEAEISVLEGYLPKPLSKQELEAIVREVIKETGATSLKQSGQVMKTLMPRIQGRAEGSEVHQLVRKLLESSE
jgi:hypothetical protein